MLNNNLELTPDEKILYYKPSFSFNSFQISTEHLINETINESELAEQVSITWNTMSTAMEL